MKKQTSTTAVRPTALEKRANEPFPEWQSKNGQWGGWPTSTHVNGIRRVEAARPDDDVILLSVREGNNAVATVQMPFKAARALGHWLIHNAVEKGGGQ